MGNRVEEAARKVCVAKMVGYEWEKRWNRQGVEAWRFVLPAEILASCRWADNCFEKAS